MPRSVGSYDGSFTKEKLNLRVYASLEYSEMIVRTARKGKIRRTIQANLVQYNARARYFGQIDIQCVNIHVDQLQQCYFYSIVKNDGSCICEAWSVTMAMIWNYTIISLALKGGESDSIFYIQNMCASI